MLRVLEELLPTRQAAMCRFTTIDPDPQEKSMTTTDQDPTDMAESEIFLTTAEACEYTGIPVGTIDLLEAVGLGPNRYEIDGRRVYRVIDLDEWRTGGTFADDIRHGIGRVTDALVEMAGAFDQPKHANQVIAAA